MTEHIKTRKQLKDVVDIKVFNDLLENTVLSDEEKYILKEHYLNDKNFAFIADKLGYVESTVLKKHKKILAKVGKMLLK